MIGSHRIEEAHPSFYALDRRRAGLPTPPNVDAHVAACPLCARHIADLNVALSPPSWLHALGERPNESATAQPAARAVPSWRWLALAPGLAAAALLVFLTHGRDDVDATKAPSPYIAEKGMPAVVVYLKRGDRVAAWDGRTPLRKADSLRFQIAKGPYDYASIATVERGDRAPVVLWSGQLEKAGAAALLPISFRVDDQDAAEVVSLVLSSGPVSPSDHRPRHDEKPSLHSWRRVLVFPKESASVDAAAAPERTP